MLPFVVRSFEVSPRCADAAVTLRKVYHRLEGIAGDLATLADYFDSRELKSAHDRLMSVMEDIANSAESCEQSDAGSAASSLRTAIAGINGALQHLSQQDSVRYRLWLLNPWRNWPQRLSATSLPPGPKNLEQ